MAAALLLHWRVAVLRDRALLEHDESIALLEAAGKAAEAESLFQPPGQVHVFTASELQNLLKPSARTSPGDVISSLASYDIHPPLYFCSLLELQHLGLDSPTQLRLLGTMLFILTAWIADRWIWPDAPKLARLLAAAWLLLAPACVEVATELRQYALVWLGTALSIAGLVQLNSAQARRLRALILLTTGSLILAYSHLGTVAWIAVLLAVTITIHRRDRSARSVLATAIILTAGLTSPLAVWLIRKPSQLGRSPTIGVEAWWTQAALPICRTLSQVWISLPQRLTSSTIMAVTALLIVAICLLALRRSARVDRILTLAVGIWAIVWFLLLETGKLPPHATTPKYLGPLALGSLAILVRATGSRSIAIAALSISSASHLAAVVRTLQRPTQDALLRAIHDSDFFVVSNPRRGYLLPVVEQMRPDARVAIAGSAAWQQLAPQLPESGVTLLEIGGPAAELREGLSRKYGKVEVIRSEPARTLTAFRKT